MKALDAFLDTRSADKRLDSRVGFFSSVESIEFQWLRQRFLTDKSQRQSIGIASNFFSIASPIMPLGFLAAFFALGRMDSMDQGPQLLERNGGLKAQMARIAAYEAMQRLKKKNGGDVDDDGYLKYAARQLELRPLKIALSSPKMTEHQLLPKRKGRQQNDERFFTTRDKAVTANKLRRKKIFLEAVMEKERGTQEFSEASAISAKIDSLDKLLKRLGA